MENPDPKKEYVTCATCEFRDYKAHHFPCRICDEKLSEWKKKKETYDGPYTSDNS